MQSPLHLITWYPLFLVPAGIGWGAVWVSAGPQRIDLQLGADGYKTRWATTSYDTLDTLIAAEGLLPQARAVVAGIDLAFTAKAALGSRRPGTGKR